MPACHAGEPGSIPGGTAKSMTNEELEVYLQAFAAIREEMDAEHKALMSILPHVNTAERVEHAITALRAVNATNRRLREDLARSLGVAET